MAHAKEKIERRPGPGGRAEPEEPAEAQPPPPQEKRPVQFRAPPSPTAPLDAALGETALHRNRFIATLGIALLIAAVELWAPPSHWRPWPALALAALALALGGEVIQNSFRALGRARVDGDSVATLGALAGFFGGTTAAVLQSLGRLSREALGSASLPASGGLTLGLEAAVLLFSLPHLSRFLEARGKALAIRKLLVLRALRPARTRLLEEDGPLDIPVASVRGGNRVSVQPGERIPVDGVLVEGEGLIDETIFAGESRILRRPGDHVYAGTLNREKLLVVRAEGSGASCALMQALEIPLAAQSTAVGSSAALVWATSALSALGVSLAAIILATLWSAGQGYGPAITAAVCALTAAWPGPLLLGAQCAAQAALALAAGQGVMVRAASVLGRLSRADVAFFAKTGTLTGAQPQVAEVQPLRSDISPEEIVFLATVLEIRSEHPIADGILKAGGGHHRTIPSLRAFRAIPGRGLRAQYQGKELLFGSLALLADAGVDITPAAAAHAALAERGLSPLVLGWGGEVQGVVAMADEERPGSREAVAELRGMGISCVLLTGDCRGAAESLARRLGLDEALWGLSLPEKGEAVERWAREGKVTLAIGHGVADAAALAAAGAGIALRAADDLALDAADALVLGPDPRGASRLVRLAHAMRAASGGAFAVALTVSVLTLAAVSLAAANGRPLPVVWPAVSAAVATVAASTFSRWVRPPRHGAAPAPPPEVRPAGAPDGSTPAC